MKSLVLLTFFALNPSEPMKNGPTEFFDDRQACQARMQELRATQGKKGPLRCSCHETVSEVEVEGTDAI